MGIASLMVYNLPIIMAVLAGLFFHRWGNQFYIAMIDMLLIQLASMTVEIMYLRREQKKNG